MAKIHSLELTGQRFGRWLVLGRSHVGNHGVVMWLCRCDCGAEKTVKAALLRRGESKSCGCYHRERVTIHGMTKTRTWKTWDSMFQRCENPNSPDYHRYGGRGIHVCERWHLFANFYADMGDRPDGMSLDRIKVDLGYSPENCRWATESQQQRNRRDAVMVTWRGETKNIHDWSERLGIKMDTLKNRLGAGWPVERAMMTPTRPKRPSRKGT
jgi:hypothetical protein